MAPRADVAAIVVGGGGGERLGGVSKPDLTLGGVRVIDRVCGVLVEACGAGCVAVVPPSVRVPEGVMRTLEDPPNGGPLAGIDAGLRALGIDDDVLVVVVSVDAPGLAGSVPALLDPPLGPDSEGRIAVGGDPEPFDQYLMGVYRAGALRRVIDEAVAASVDSADSADSADSEASAPSEAARSWESAGSATPASERDRSTSADCASPRMS